MNVTLYGEDMDTSQRISTDLEKLIKSVNIKYLVLMIVSKSN